MTIRVDLDFPGTGNPLRDSFDSLGFELSSRNTADVLNTHLMADHSGLGTGVPEHDIGQAEAFGFCLQPYVNRVQGNLLRQPAGSREVLVLHLIRTLKRIQRGIDRGLIPDTRIEWDLLAGRFPFLDEVVYSVDMDSDGVTYPKILSLALEKTATTGQARRKIRRLLGRFRVKA